MLDLVGRSGAHADDEAVHADALIGAEIVDDLLDGAVERSVALGVEADTGAEAHANRVRVATSLLRFGADLRKQGLHFIRRQVRGWARADGQPHVAIAGGTANRWRGMAADPDWRMRLLNGQWVGAQ